MSAPVVSCRFPLGRLVATPAAIEALETPEALLALVRRHASGDWGDVCDEDADANNEALRLGNRVLSAYNMVGASEWSVWVITEADRSVTTVLLPSDY